MREQGKINQPEHTAGGSQNKGTKKLQRRAAPSPLEGRRQRGGARGKLSPREATPSHTTNRPWFLSKDFLRPDQRRALGRRREKAHRTRGKCAKPLAARAARCRGKKAHHARGEATQTSGCPGHSPRREKGRSTLGEAPKTAGCPARTRRVHPIHGDICLQHPALPAAVLNCTSEPK